MHPTDPSPMFMPLNLRKWVQEHRHELKPPVGNKQVWRDERETIIMVVGGPNSRKDYHVNATEEFFYQIEGDIAVGIIHPQTGKPEEVVIREGDIYLLPANVPHSPRRPAGTVGLVVELKRPEGAVDKLQWYCDRCDDLVYEAEFELENIAVDLKKIMGRFWEDEALRTCKSCGAVVTPPEEAKKPSPSEA